MKYLADGGVKPEVTITPTITLFPTVKPTVKTATTSGYVYKGLLSPTVNGTGKVVDLVLFVILVAIILLVLSILKLHGRPTTSTEPSTSPSTSTSTKPSTELHPVKPTTTNRVA